MIAKIRLVGCAVKKNQKHTLHPRPKRRGFTVLFGKDKKRTPDLIY